MVARPSNSQQESQANFPVIPTFAIRARIDAAPSGRAALRQTARPDAADGASNGSLCAVALPSAPGLSSRKRVVQLLLARMGERVVVRRRRGHGLLACEQMRSGQVKEPENCSCVCTLGCRPKEVEERRKEKGSESEVKALKRCVCSGKALALLQHRDRQLSPPAACAVPPLFLVPQRWYREVLHATAILQGAL
jgi:hypothetical protein